MPPLIGLTSGRVPVGGRVFDGVDEDYAAAVTAAGGTPVILVVSDPGSADELVGRLDGLVFTGGGDIDPSRYGRPADPATAGVDADRDSFELSLARAAIERRIPVLGICRGCQVLNVALGGSLHQHLPALSPLNHLAPTPRQGLVHEVEPARGSRLEQVTGSAGFLVNSIHHQALDRLAPGLRASARAPDGIVEAVEHPDVPLLAVQWHPECLHNDEPHASLFRWLVSSCRREAGVV